jgi:predicted porin
MGGFTVELAYGAGEVAGNNTAGRQLGAALDYAKGPLRVRLGYHDRNNETATAPNTQNGRNTVLGATYDFRVVKGHFAYGTNRGPNSSWLRNNDNPFGYPTAPQATTDSNDMLFGITVPFGTHALLASYIRKDDRTALDQDADQLAVGYRYGLSKRTDLFGSYARIDNKNGAGYTVGSAIESGSGDQAVSVGIRHSF